MNRTAPRHLRAVLDRTSPRPEDYAHAWLMRHGERHWPEPTRAQFRRAEKARTSAHTVLEDLFPTGPITGPLAALGGAA